VDSIKITEGRERGFRRLFLKAERGGVRVRKRLIYEKSGQQLRTTISTRGSRKVRTSGSN
jgi:hypothetical protein